MNDSKESNGEWSKEFLAWGNREEQEEQLNIDRSDSPWREIDLSDLLDEEEDPEK